MPGCYAPARPCRGTCRGWATRPRTTPRGGRAIAEGTGYAPAYVQLPATHHAMMHAGELAHFYQDFFFSNRHAPAPRRICYPGRSWHARAYTRDSVGTVPGALACASIHQDCIPTVPQDALVCAAHPPVLHPRRSSDQHCQVAPTGNTTQERWCTSWCPTRPLQLGVLTNIVRLLPQTTQHRSSGAPAGAQPFRSNQEF